MAKTEEELQAEERAYVLAGATPGERRDRALEVIQRAQLRVDRIAERKAEVLAELKRRGIDGVISGAKEGE